MKAFEALERRLPKSWGRLVQRPVWLAGFLAAVAFLLVVFVTGARISGIEPGNTWGRTYGTLAALLMLAAALLGVRRRQMARSWGRTQTWVQLHVYGGTVFLLLAVLHAPGWPDSGLGRALVILSAWVVVSGLLGVALRKWIPRVLTSGLSFEVLYERIPDLCEEVERRAEAAVAGGSRPLAEFHRRRIAPHLGKPRFRPRAFLDPLGGGRRRMRESELVQDLLSEAERKKLAELRRLYRTQRELDAHYTLQLPLRLWLWVHVPVSLVLLLLVLIHVFTVLYY